MKNSRETRWEIHLPFSPCGATNEQLGWLLDSSSLTRRLQQACKGQLQVVPVNQQWKMPQLNEAQALGIRPRESCFIREVHLWCDNQPWVYARTVIPVSTLTGNRRRLSRLGKKSLGAVLFADPGMQRSHIEIARLGAGQALFEAAVVPLAERPEEIWGRRSVFLLDKKPLLVSEIFLPEIGYGRDYNGCK